MEMVKTYSGHEVSVIVEGRAMKGFADGDDVIKIERDADAWLDTAGLNGEVTRSANADKRGKITLRFMRSSKDNDYLSALAVADEAAKTGIVSVMVRDPNGTTIHAAEQAWIMKLAGDSIGKNVGEREWVFRCARLDMFCGGN